MTDVRSLIEVGRICDFDRPRDDQPREGTIVIGLPALSKASSKLLLDSWKLIFGDLTTSRRQRRSITVCIVHKPSILKQNQGTLLDVFPDRSTTCAGGESAVFFFGLGSESFGVTALATFCRQSLQGNTPAKRTATGT